MATIFVANLSAAACAAISAHTLASLVAVTSYLSGIDEQAFQRLRVSQQRLSERTHSDLVSESLGVGDGVVSVESGPSRMAA